MSAITGLYAPARKQYSRWIDWWLFRSSRCDDKRVKLAEQLRIIRTQDKGREAREFRNYLLWIGTYPVRLR